MKTNFIQLLIRKTEDTFSSADDIINYSGIKGFLQDSSFNKNLSNYHLKNKTHLLENYVTVEKESSIRSYKMVDSIAVSKATKIEKNTEAFCNSLKNSPSICCHFAHYYHVDLPPFGSMV